MEHQVLAEFVRMLKISRNTMIEAQVLQYLSIQIQNIRNEHAIYYCFTNGHINSIITHEYEFNAGDLAMYFVSFLRTVSAKRNKDSICLLLKVKEENAKTKVNENLASSSKSQIEIEISVFNDLMYGDKTPKRPSNYGFGVKQTHIYGVRSLVSHGRHDHVNNPMEEIKNLRADLTLMSVKNQALAARVEENNKNFKMIASNIAKVLRAVCDGNTSPEMLDGAEAALNMVNNEVSD